MVKGSMSRVKFWDAFYYRIKLRWVLEDDWDWLKKKITSFDWMKKTPRGYNTVTDGWAGAYNSLTHPLLPPNTRVKGRIRVFTHSNLIITDQWIDQWTDGRTKLLVESPVRDLKKQGRIQGHQLRTGGQGGNALFDSCSWTDGPTDRPTDGQRLL